MAEVLSSNLSGSTPFSDFHKVTTAIMNVPNNKRRQNTILKIHTAFIDFLQERELNEISVTDICNAAEINRTTFYANYSDINALAESEMKKLEADMIQIFEKGFDKSSSDDILLRLFTYIKDNQPQCKLYFKLGLSGRFPTPDAAIGESNHYHNDIYGKYHQEYFRAGLSAIIKMWVDGGCVETPEELLSVLHREYNWRD